MILKAGLIFAVIMLTGLAGAATLRVCPDGCDLSSVQAAIGASQPGDTIEVESGTYAENVRVDRRLHLIGVDTGQGMPVIDAGGRSSAITLSADGIVIEGFNATNSGGCSCGNAGIRINSNNNTVSGNTACDSKYGIYSSGRTGNRITGNNLINNDITAYDSGMNLWDQNYYDGICPDSNEDGICDVPMNISSGSNVDMRPLAGMAMPMAVSSE